METELYQIGTIGVFSIVVIREGVKLLKWVLSSRKNGNGKDNKQDVNLAIINERLKAIENNHLPHILEAVNTNMAEHTEIKVKLAQIDAKLDYLIKK